MITSAIQIKNIHIIYPTTEKLFASMYYKRKSLKYIQSNTTGLNNRAKYNVEPFENCAT